MPESAPDAAAESAPARREILAALSGSITPPAVPASYQVALAAVSLAMVILPLVYVALIGAAAYATYYHAVHNVTWLVGHGGRFRLLAYATPIVSGVTLVLFMVKPLFARRAAAAAPRSLDRRQEPFIHAFVERLCGVVGAPVPTRIDVDCQVNASASRLGFAGAGGLVLTIGLPLAAGLSLRQMAGVLAHEFGHFGQGAGMRLSGVIRRVNYWFARVVHERDRWDASLEEWCKGRDSTAVIAWAARAFVWLSRRVLQLLMFLGHALSCALMRQMEHDADRYEALLAGSATFGETARRMRVLGAAHHLGHAELADSWREGRLAADLPRFVAARAQALPAAMAALLARGLEHEKTGWFDTHPCDAERIARTAALGAPGLFQVDAPATALFQDFEGLAREASLDHYRELAGEAVSAEHLVPNEAILGARAAREESGAAFARVSQGLVDVDHLIFPHPGVEPAVDRLAAQEAVRRARARFERELPAARESFKQLEQGIARLLEAAQAEQLLDVRLKPNVAQFHLGSATREGIAEAHARGAEMRSGALAALATWDSALAGRFSASLALALTADLAAQLVALATLGAASAALESLREGFARLAVLLANLEGREENETLVTGIRSSAATLRGTLIALSAALGGCAYPFEHGEGAITIAAHVVPQPPASDDVGAIYHAAREALDRYLTLYVRLMGQLALAVERAETKAGLEPLPAPSGE